MTLSLPPHVVATDTDDGLILLDQRRGRYWRLNGTGAAAFRMLLDGHSPAQTGDLLIERFPGATASARDDVETLVQALTAAQLVVWR
jgi:hypothetical protein